ncbi:hypothetical protein Bca101_047404 [Brassica carinata]
MCTEQWLKCEIRINEKTVVSHQQLIAEIELQDELQKVRASAALPNLRLRMFHANHVLNKVIFDVDAWNWKEEHGGLSHLFLF